MYSLRRQSGVFRIAFTFAALGLLATTAGADPLLPGAGSESIELVWPTPPVPDDSADLPPVESFDIFTNELFAAGYEAPGLEFSLSPVDEEIFLGWRFAF